MNARGDSGAAGFEDHDVGGPGVRDDAGAHSGSGRRRGGPGRPAAGGQAAGHADAGDPETAAKNLCLRWLAVQGRSRAELAAKLRERGIPDDAAERALDRLARVGLIDDAAYAAAFVASRHRDRGLGRLALRRELQRKGIDRDLAEQALEPIDGDAERSRAAALVAKKLDSAMFAGSDAARRRLLGMLARRGYSPGVAIAVVNDALRGFTEPLDPSADLESDPDTGPEFDPDSGAEFGG
jgi:regulatory protein